VRCSCKPLLATPSVTVAVTVQSVRIAGRHSDGSVHLVAVYVAACGRRSGPRCPSVAIPATGESIVEYRRTNGLFRSVEELTSIRNCKIPEFSFRALLSEGGTALCFQRT